MRLSSIGFSKDRVNAQLRQNAENRYRLFTLEYRPPYKPKKFPLEDELRKLGFSIEHSVVAPHTVLVDAVFYLVITADPNRSRACRCNAAVTGSAGG